ncbi:hypothetical protein DM01DRAFT_1349277 [Hesseltinella vesiculosa]|uniref:Uncharacterized protein n=1 Tax=Hesseltinella vesiculosa TaxID=101127 RepID=A0A1X2G5J9_9FUNG|nr:hypothetical protein DM01DRAFT_1349277 [Hesseltinella vesiculosa]
MASIDEKLYAAVHEKAKEHNLTDQEIKAIDTARQQISSHTSLGGFGGAASAALLGGSYDILVMLRRSNEESQTAAIACRYSRGFLFGSQVGFVAGALASVNTIKSLPNPQRVVEVIREVQEEARRQIGQPNATRPPMQRATMPISDPGSVPGHGPQDDKFITDDLSVHGEYATANSEFQTDQASQMQQKQGWPSKEKPAIAVQTQANQPAQQSAWDKIRASNQPNSAWAKVRQEAAQHPTDIRAIEAAKAKRVEQLKETEVSFDNLPRTREEADQRVKFQRNQYGDPVG